jgi:carbon monoxide dehydrogenase subunit G
LEEISMDMTGEYRITAPRPRVWAALNDPTILQQCIPGCEEIQKLSDVEWTAKVTAKVGPVKAKFGGKVLLTDLDPPNGYKITGEGTGGAAGFAKGGAVVKLADDGPGTILSYTVQANVGGKLAQIGSRLIDGASRKMADEFFARFAEIVGAPVAGEAAAAPAPPAASAAAPAAAAPAAGSTADAAAPPPRQPALAPRAAEPARSGLSPVVWAAGLAIVLAAVLYVFTR